MVHEHCTLLSQKPGDPISDPYIHGGPVLQQISAHSCTSLELFFYTCTTVVIVTQHVKTQSNHIAMDSFLFVNCEYFSLDWIPYKA